MSDALRDALEALRKIADAVQSNEPTAITDDSSLAVYDDPYDRPSHIGLTWGDLRRAAKAYEAIRANSSDVSVPREVLARALGRLSYMPKVANQRRDYLHRVSTRIARENARIYIGDVSSSRLTQTRMAKSVHDAGWAMLKHMLSYKAIALGGVCEVVSEKWTTRTCSACGSIPDSSPKGMSALGMRQWVCADCGASHDRDVNAARNILMVGAERRPLAEGIST